MAIPRPATLQRGGLDRQAVVLMAIACGTTVANLYYNQAFLGDLTRTFGVSEQSVGLAVTLSQTGYAIGILFLVPLGDVLDRRGLVVGLLGAVTAGLACAALAPNAALFIVFSFVIGFCTVVPQVLIPLAATLAEPEERGKVVGAMQSGLLTGILVARTIAGGVAAFFGWRAMYWIAAGLMIVLALLLFRFLPRRPAQATLKYPVLMRSLLGLVRSEPGLRLSCVLGGLIFGAFSVFWTTLAFFLRTPPYHYGPAVVGLFGLVGAGGALSAPFVGRLADRAGPTLVNGLAIGVVLASFLTFAVVGRQVWGLVAGVILLDVGTQSNQISNQARIFALRAEANSRLNTVYMVCTFAGGACGSLLGAWSWSRWQWNGVCGAGAILVVATLAVYLRAFAFGGLPGVRRAAAD
ncbi:MAG: MFS transporter [Chloroflexota bacterium]